MFLPLAALLALAGQMAGQDTVRTRTLLQPSKLHYLGVFVAPEFQYGQSNGVFTRFSGGSAMLLFNKRFAMGVTMQHSLDRRFSPAGVSPLALRSAFGGAKLEYTLMPNSAVHVTFPLVLGAGIARADSLRTLHAGHLHGIDENGRSSGLRGEYFIVQPGVQVEANLLRWAKLYVGANYRIASRIGEEASTTPGNSLQGASISAGLKLGWFDFHLRKKESSK